MKYLLLLGVILVVWLLMHKARRKPPPAAGPGRQAPAAATMLSCAHCGLHVPAAEAVLDAGGRPFCGEAHRLAGPR